LIRGIVEDRKKRVDKSLISRKFHNTVMAFSVEICKILRKEYGHKGVALSGGVFQNELLLKGIYRELTAAGFRVYTQAKIPCNDSGLSAGQLVIASKRERGRD